MPTITPPTTLQRVLRGIGYLCIGASGVWVAVLAPDLMRNSLGVTLALIWCVCLLAALPAAAAAFMGRYRGEYIALPWFTFAIVVATAFVWVRVGFSPDILVPRALMLTALCMSLGVRYAGLHKLVGLRKEGPRWTRSR